MAEAIDQSATRGFLDIPQETLVDILSRFDYDDLCVCMQVCRSLRRAVIGTPSLAYKLCLERNGMRDNRSSDRPLQERLVNIQEYERRWRTLDWSAITPIHVPESHRWAVSQTVLFYHNILDAPSEQHCTFIRLLSPLRGITMLKWNYPLPYINVFLAVDPSNDLILATGRDSDEYTCVYPLQLSTGVGHPNAVRSILKLGEHTIPTRPPVVFGTNLLLQYISLPETFQSTIDDWTMPSDDMPMDLPHDYEASPCFFLNTCTVAALSSQSPDSEQLCISMYSRITMPGNPPHYELSGNFVLPRLFLRGQWSPTFACAPRPSPHPLMPVGDFYPDGEDVLLTITSGFSGSYEGEIPSLLIRSSSLLSLLSESRVRSWPHSIPWDEWGPANSHGLLCSGRRNANPVCIHGLRAIPGGKPFKRDDGEWVFQVNDYHPRRVSAALALASQVPENERNWCVKFGEELYLQEPWFESKEPLITKLPYIATQKVLPKELLGDAPERLSVTLAEDGLIIQQNERLQDTPDLRILPADLQVLSF